MLMAAKTKECESISSAKIIISKWQHFIGWNLIEHIYYCMAVSNALAYSISFVKYRIHRSDVYRCINTIVHSFQISPQSCAVASSRRSNRVSCVSIITGTFFYHTDLFDHHLQQQSFTQHSLQSF